MADRHHDPLSADGVEERRVDAGGGRDLEGHVGALPRPRKLAAALGNCVGRVQGERARALGQAATVDVRLHRDHVGGAHERRELGDH